jgi:hypothetical protein
MATRGYICENIIGDEYALIYIDPLKRGGVDVNYFALSRIIGDMVKAGHYRGQRN